MNRLAPAYRNSMPEEAMLDHLRSLQRAIRGPVADLAVEREPDGFLLRVTTTTELVYSFALDDEDRITRISLRAATPSTRGETSRADPVALTWPTLRAHFRELEARGFRGVVLARRGSEEVLLDAFGEADPASKRANALQTVFDIGSIPIDFTATMIRMLAQRRMLALSDSLGRFFPEVPADKRGITLDQLLSGRSGLENFHDDPSVDRDPDLSWIDRATAVRRILAKPLLFQPGGGPEHSHSAFGLLAAVIEVVTGGTYAEFLRSEILRPLEMTRTGFYGESNGLDVTDFAIGAGPGRAGVPSIPPNWGPASWLVMGSGGMYSTLPDLDRYFVAKAGGALFGADSASHRQAAGIALGGTDRGYFVMRVSDGKGSSVLALMNWGAPQAERMALFEAIRALVMSP